MFEYLNKPYPFQDDIKHNLRKIFGIALSIFLFILFFQPFSPDFSEFNKNLFYFSGYGIIIALVLVFFLILLPALFKSFFLKGKWSLGRDILLNTGIFICVSTATSFYTYYIGRIQLSVPVLFRIVLLGLVPVAILVVVNQFQLIKFYLQRAIDKNKQDGKQGQDVLDYNEIEFFPDGKSKPLNIPLQDIILIKSANNYIEVFCYQNNELKKYLIRNTLKYGEHLLKPYGNVVRCHRNCLINANYVITFKTGAEGPRLKVRHIAEEVPVSRQYILKVKESLGR